MYGETPTQSRRRAGAESWQALSEDQKWAAGAGRGASAAFEFAAWKLLGFSDADRDVWTDAGVPVNRAKAASELRAAGVRPGELATRIQGCSALAYIQKGLSDTWIASKASAFG